MCQRSGGGGEVGVVPSAPDESPRTKTATTGPPRWRVYELNVVVAAATGMLLHLQRLVTLPSM